VEDFESLISRDRSQGSKKWQYVRSSTKRVSNTVAKLTNLTYEIANKCST